MCDSDCLFDSLIYGPSSSCLIWSGIKSATGRYWNYVQHEFFAKWVLWCADCWYMLLVLTLAFQNIGFPYQQVLHTKDLHTLGLAFWVYMKKNCYQKEYKNMNTVNVRKMLAIIIANQKNASILVLADSISVGKVSRCAQAKTDLFHSSYGVTVRVKPWWFFRQSCLRESWDINWNSISPDLSRFWNSEKDIS